MATSSKNYNVVYKPALSMNFCEMALTEFLLVTLEDFISADSS